MALTVGTIAFAGLLFVLRVINYAISTMRLVFITRGWRTMAAVMAFFEALIFAVVMASVVADLNNMLNLMAYCLGAAAGSYVGMMIEARIINSYATVQIITRTDGETLAQKLRACGYGVTETEGRGRDGQVVIIRSSINTHDIPSVLDVVKQTTPDAFVEIEPATKIERGWIPGMPGRTYRS